MSATTSATIPAATAAPTGSQTTPVTEIPTGTGPATPSSGETPTPTATKQTKTPYVPPPATVADCGTGQAVPLAAADSPALTSAEVVTASGPSLYTVTDDTVHPLIDKTISQPIFRSSGTVTYTRLWKGQDKNHFLGRDNVFQLSTAGGTETQLLHLPNRVEAMTWNPSGSKLAYLVKREGKKRRPLTTVLCLYNADSGTVKLLGESDGPPPYVDQVSIPGWAIGWSPDGSAIYVNENYGQLRVVSPTGKILLPELYGNYPTWLPDGQLLFDKGNRWAEWDPATGQMSTLPLPKGTFDASPSPDGTEIALVKAKGSEPIGEVLDLTTGDITKLGGHVVAPIWLSSTEIAFTRTHACPTGNAIPCDLEYPISKTVGVDITTLTQTKLQLPSTSSNSIFQGVAGPNVRLP